MWGGSGNVGEWWDCIVVHCVCLVLERRVLCKCSGNCGFSFMLRGIPDLRRSWQRGLLHKWSLRQSKEFSYFYHETLSKSFLPRDIVAGLVLFLTLPEFLKVVQTGCPHTGAENILVTTTALWHPGTALPLGWHLCWAVSQGQRLKCSLDN